VEDDGYVEKEEGEEQEEEEEEDVEDNNVEEDDDQAPAFTFTVRSSALATCCQAAVSWPGWCWLSAPWICGTAPENPWLPGTNQAPNPKDKPKDHQGGNLMKLS